MTQQDLFHPRQSGAHTVWEPAPSVTVVGKIAFAPEADGADRFAENVRRANTPDHIADAGEKGKRSQAAQILAYLREGHTLTDLGEDGKPGALSLFNCRRLSGRIFDINHNVNGVNPSGDRVWPELFQVPGGAWVARYSL